MKLIGAKLELVGTTCGACHGSAARTGSLCGRCGCNKGIEPGSETTISPLTSKIWRQLRFRVFRDTRALRYEDSDRGFLDRDLGLDKDNLRSIDLDADVIEYVKEATNRLCVADVTAEFGSLKLSEHGVGIFISSDGTIRILPLSGPNPRVYNTVYSSMKETKGKEMRTRLTVEMAKDILSAGTSLSIEEQWELVRLIEQLEMGAHRRVHCPYSPDDVFTSEGPPTPQYFGEKK